MTASENHYFYRSRISDKKIREIVRYFSLDIEVSKISKLTNLSRNTVNTYVNKMRVKISNYCEVKTEFKGEIELDESYFGGKKKGDKRGRGVSNKVPVFGFLKRKGKVKTQTIKTPLAKANYKRFSRKREYIYT